MAAAQQTETRNGVTYATHDGVSLAGDLYLPAGAGPYPALVGVHGGGWQAGARNAFQFWGPWLAERGYVLFAISYRLAKKGHKMFPQAVQRRARRRAVRARQRRTDQGRSRAHRRSSAPRPAGTWRRSPRSAETSSRAPIRRTPMPASAPR